MWIEIENVLNRAEKFFDELEEAVKEKKVEVKEIKECSEDKCEHCDYWEDCVEHDENCCECDCCDCEQDDERIVMHFDLAVLDQYGNRTAICKDIEHFPEMESELDCYVDACEYFLKACGFHFKSLNIEK